MTPKTWDTEKHRMFMLFLVNANAIKLTKCSTTGKKARSLYRLAFSRHARTHEQLFLKNTFFPRYLSWSVFHH